MSISPADRNSWSDIVLDEAGKTDDYHAQGAVQPRLVSGENIKTVNGQSLLGSGNLSVSGGGGASIAEQIAIQTLQI